MDQQKRPLNIFFLILEEQHLCPFQSSCIIHFDASNAMNTTEDFLAFD